MHFRGYLTALLAFTFVVPSHSFAAPPKFQKIQSEDLPRTLEKSTEIKAPVRPELFNCDRKVTYRGKEFNCDTYTDQNGENLRPILSQVPEALSELDLYQRERKSLKIAAYVGSIGLLTFLTALIIKGQVSDQASDSTKNTLSIISYSGLGLTTGSLIWGVSAYRSTEHRLENAVNIYNQQRPKDPIQVEFSTGFQF